MKKIFPFIFGFLVLFLLLILVFLFGRPETLVFSTPSGFYKEAFKLSIKTLRQNETIHYTLDGSIPTMDSPIYTEPLFISDRSGDPNDISMISTFSYRPAVPKGNVFKINVVRARSYNNITKAPGPIVTQSYLVSQEIYERYSFPIVSLVVDPDDFFDPEFGIYVTGEEPEKVAADGDYYFFWPGNYHERGEDWERPIHFEFFDLNGNFAFSQNAGVRIHGGASRSYRQKSLRLYASNKYDVYDKFNYLFFPGLVDDSGKRIIEQFETLILRNGGTDFGSSFMRDALIQGLVEHTTVDTQANRPVITFLNGEYWGLYYLYERYDEGYFFNHYGIQPENIIMLEDRGDVVIGAEKERAVFQNLLDYVNKNDINDPSVYQEIKTKIDIENFIDYQITEIYIAHQDWPENNIKYWRTRIPIEDPTGKNFQDGRWRWLLFDTDHGFIYHDLNSIEYATREDLPTDLFRNLIKNPEFLTLFLNRFADHLNTTFRVERVLQEIDSLEALLEPGMQEQIDRWHSSGNSMEDWHNNVNLLRSFAGKRPEVVIQDLIEFFELDGTFALTLKGKPEMGTLQVNTIEVASSTPGIQNPELFTGIYFIGVPIRVTAIPSAGYKFSHWEGSIFEGESKAEIEILVDEDISLEPVFVPVD